LKYKSNKKSGPQGPLWLLMPIASQLYLF